MARTSDTETGLPPSLRFLRALVIVLMVSMIAGVIALVWLLVTRLPQAMRPGPELPSAITLPQDEAPAAITFGKGWTAVVTESDKILIYRKDGTLSQEILLNREENPQ